MSEAEANTGGWQAYAVGEANRLKAEYPTSDQRSGGHNSPFADEWASLTAPQQASAIRELGLEAKAGDKVAASTLAEALDNSNTKSTKVLNDALNQLGFKDVVITNDYVNNFDTDEKGITINGPNGQYFHDNGAWEITAINNPAYGDGKVYNSPQAVFDYALGHTATSWDPSDRATQAATDALTNGKIKREDWMK